MSTMPAMEATISVGVYGLGRFGSFWAKELAKHGFPVIGYGRSAKAAPEGVLLGSEDEVLSCSALFYCVSISSFSEVLDRTSSRIADHTVVMDTCSVKLYPAKLMREKLPKQVQCIATHPMFGPDSGKNGIAGLPLVISGVRCEDETFQGITHFIGRTLSELSLGETELATTGYKTLLTVMQQTCNDPLQLFYDLQRYNPYARQMRMGLKGALDTVMDALKKQEEGR